MSRVLKVELARAPDTFTTRGWTEVNRFCGAAKRKGMGRVGWSM
jgi:hypothetical protein